MSKEPDDDAREIEEYALVNEEALGDLLTVQDLLDLNEGVSPAGVAEGFDDNQI